MFHATMRSAIEGARTLAQLDSLSRTIWQAHAAETVTDSEAQGLAEALHTRRAAIREAVVPVGIPLGRVTLFPPKRLQRAPERSVAIERRRWLACPARCRPHSPAGSPPGSSRSCGSSGTKWPGTAPAGCASTPSLPGGRLPSIGTGRDRLAEGGRAADHSGAPPSGRKSDPNVIRIISREWLQWLRRGGRSAAPALLGSIGCKTIHPTDKGDPQREVVDAELKKGCRQAAVRAPGVARGNSAAGPSRWFRAMS